MTALTEEQYLELEQRLCHSGIKNAPLQADLFDHFCCLTQERMLTGENFETAAEQAMQQLAPLGFGDIEQELQLFFTFKTNLNMNRILFFGGFLAAFGQTLYILLRTQKWPGSELFLSLAIAALFFMVIPVLAYKLNSQYNSLSSAVRWRIISGISGIALFGMGSAFKLLHWPGASIQIVLGTVLLAFIFMPLFFWQQYRQTLAT